mgnify:CR=1 FL=1
MTDENIKDIENKLILVVDDQGSIRFVVDSYFKEMGFENIVTAFDGNDALTFLSQNAVDIVICDWQMPKISGLELLKLIRGHENTANLPFIMMTSTSELQNVKDAASFGVSDYLIKPFQPAQLGYKVIQLLTKSKHQAKRLPLNIEKLQTGDANPVDLEDHIE